MEDARNGGESGGGHEGAGRQLVRPGSRQPVQVTSSSTRVGLACVLVTPGSVRHDPTQPCLTPQGPEGSDGVLRLRGQGGGAAHQLRQHRLQPALPGMPPLQGDDAGLLLQGLHRGAEASAAVDGGELRPMDCICRRGLGESRVRVR